VVSACIIVPQAIVACVAPWIGRVAQNRGRRPVLLVGFAALPVRAVLLAFHPGALPLIAIQALDGISATVFGLMLPLIAADLTRRTGYLNFAIGSIGLATGIGATFSTSAAGWIADTAGPETAFLALAATGAAALALLFVAMPETRPTRTAAKPAPAAAT
jgi:predicted MFS family arabinose efflux permease